MQDLPNSLAVMGSSSIGLELAQAMARLGVEVTLFDNGNRLGGVRCDKVHAALKAAIEDDLCLFLNVELKPSAADAGIRIELSGDSSGDATFDYALVATGRPPNLDSLNLVATGLALDDNGVPEHGRETMQCGDSPIFLASDAGHDLPAPSRSLHYGAIAGRNAVAFPASIKADRFTAFGITLTSPPVS